MGKTRDAKIFEWRKLWDIVVETEPEKQTNILYLAGVFGSSWATANKYVNGNESIVGFVNESKVTVVVETDTAPDNWIVVDTGYSPMGTTFTGMQDVRDTLQGIVNEAMNVVDDCNGTIIAIDAVLTVMQSEARVTTLEATVKSLNNRLFLAQDDNVRLRKEMEAQKEQERLDKIAKSSQG